MFCVCRLYNGSWVFSAISENVEVTLQCPDGNIPTSLMGFGIVGLAEGCTISNEEFWYPHTFAGVMQLSLAFGDKGWDSSDFHTDLLEGQEDFLDFPDDEYSEALALAANSDAAIIIEDPTARSVGGPSTDLTTPWSSSTEQDSSSEDQSSTTTEVSSSASSEPIFQTLNVQDPENKATEIHNDILVKLKEQLRSFYEAGK